jgi:HEAT repeat protein
LISRWLQIAPKNRAWRTIILRTLTSTLQKEKETISLAAKIIAAMAFSGDAGVSLYFRQLLKSNHPNLKHLAALGCGILGDKKSIEEISLLIQEQSPASIRSGCLALAAIGDKQSLEILASSLLNGSEEMRRYAAEALANNPKEGQPALREGSSMDDLLVRRSVVFGLIRVNQPWAIKIVENLQLEDNEWVVRNAAIQAFDELQRKKSNVPTQVPDLTETRWLIDYADRIGTTVAPGKPGEQLVGKALIDGNQDEKLYALDYFRTKCDTNTKELIYSSYSNNTGEIRDYAYYILWLMTLAGINLPISFE